MKAIMKRIAVIACACALACVALAGCANNATNAAAAAEQQANRAYMSQVNEIMEELGDGLDSFVDAVSRNDVVNMRTQADNAYKALDKLSDLEVPEELADVQEKYVDGADKLREALDEYITLYTEMSGASFDASSYDSRIDAVQALYDEGVGLMAEGDETAASKS